MHMVLFVDSKQKRKVFYVFNSFFVVEKTKRKLIFVLKFQQTKGMVFFVGFTMQSEQKCSAEHFIILVYVIQSLD